MGYITTVVFYNDALSALANDTAAGDKILKASSEFNAYKGTPYESFSTGSISCNGQGVGQVVACDHADIRRLMLTGLNDADDLGVVYPYGSDEDVRVRVLKALAAELGYRVSKKPVK